MANDFYEDDESLADLDTAFDQGVKGITGPRIPGGTIITESAHTYSVGRQIFESFSGSASSVRLVSI